MEAFENLNTKFTAQDMDENEDCDDDDDVMRNAWSSGRELYLLSSNGIYFGMHEVFTFKFVSLL